VSDSKYGPRLSQPIDGPPREWNERERYQLWRRGFRDGAGSAAKRHPGFVDYERGWEEGAAARIAAGNKFAAEIGYAPSILRDDGGGQ
jgi:hypothetical protein